MTDNKDSKPKQYKRVMVSSTFTDLKDHRAALIKALSEQSLMHVARENDSAKGGVDVINCRCAGLRKALPTSPLSGGVVQFRNLRTESAYTHPPLSASSTAQNLCCHLAPKLDSQFFLQDVKQAYRLYYFEKFRVT